ncbi:hypothetical protein Ddye_023256 [Dipteronia dyeriana]|uniref:Uncharacterized protein n=1 Tax=Dipteronia dyeriana TaxID=168575 RepID=A0AAD9WT31_9ROSI|nr:hypothetical protein Ddye_023256 [Dipteronia dyeriana]
MCFSTQQITTRITPQVAEAMAMLSCIRFMIDYGLIPAIIENANSVTHSLAKLSLPLVEDHLWLEITLLT